MDIDRLVCFRNRRRSRIVAVIVVEIERRQFTGLGAQRCRKRHRPRLPDLTEA